MHKVLKIISSLTLVLVLSTTGFSQMFSVTQGPQRVSQATSFVRIGTSITDFKYLGTPGNSSLLEISDPVLSVMLDSPGLSGSIIVGNSVLGLSDKTFFDFNLKFGGGIALIRQPRVQIGVPIQLLTGFTTSSSEEFNDRFNQSTIAAGGGAFLNTSFTRRIRLQTEGVVGYGFSSSSGGIAGSNGGFFGGNVFYIHAKARLNILNLIGGRALSIGYDYNLKSFDIDQDVYDFDMNAHQITLGVSL